MNTILALLVDAWNEFKLAIILAFLCLFAGLEIQAANFTYLMNGPASTVINAPLNGGTNTSGVFTNTFQVGQVPGASNIVFQLAGGNGIQPLNGTNGFLPSAYFNSEPGYPGTLYGPNNFTTIAITGNLLATNASSTAIVFRFAANIDDATYPAGLWVTNYAVITLTVPVNGLVSTQPVVTNTIAMGGWKNLALQAIENPGASAITNIVIEVNGKPGL